VSRKTGALLFAGLLAMLVLTGSLAGAAGPIQVLVDGQPLSLDVPPVEAGGRLLVPLRGIFERLGAEVVYNKTTRAITATKGDIVVGMQLGSSIASINQRAVVLDTPPSTVQGRTMVPLRFVSEALGAKVRWIGAARVVEITTAGEAVQPSPSPSPSSISDVILKVDPVDGANVTMVRPHFMITFNPDSPRTVEPLSLRLLVNGRDVTDDCQVSNRWMAYAPGADLPYGKNTAAIDGSAGGRPFAYQWSFTVSRSGAYINSVAHTATGTLLAGSVLTVTMVGAPGGRATFDLGTYRTNLPMNEVSAGNYRGTFTVSASDNVSNLPVLVKLRISNQNPVTVEAAPRVTLAGSSGTAPTPSPTTLAVTFTSPTEGQEVEASIDIKGTTQANAAVSVTMKQIVELIAGTGLGLEQAVGTVNTQADANGVFTAHFDVANRIGGSTLVVTAVATNSAGTVSAEAKMNLKMK